MDGTAMHPKYVEAERLGREITALCGHLYAATYRLLALIREFDERLLGAAGARLLRPLAELQVRHRHPRGPREGAGGPGAEGFAGHRRGPARGEISYSKVRAMTRIADAKNEDYLLTIARHGTAYHVERLVSLYRRCRRTQEAQAAKVRHARRALEYYHDEDDCLVIKARLPAEVGEVVVKALEYAMAQDDSLDRAAGETEPGAADRQEDTETVRTLPNFAARRADALAAIAEHYLHRPPAEGSVSSGADRYQVVLHVSAEALTDVPAGTPPPEVDCSHLERGPRVPAETSRRLACDAAIVPLLETSDGEPLAIGRKSRRISPAIRRALAARDRGCRFPGCINRYRLDGHHIRHWADGGETRLDNLVQLCRHHHRLVHEGGFGCEREQDGRVLFRDPHGRRLEASYVLPTAIDTADERAFFEEYLADVDIDADTCATRWQGERIDWQLAVGHLFQ